MSSVSDALLRRIGKIKALAERGVGGEKDTAQAMLDTILARHGLTLDDIESKPARKWVEVSFSGEHERLLMLQIIRKVTQQGDLMIKRRPRARSRLYVELSPVEQVEVEFMFEVMKAALAKEMEKMTMAFIHANNLFGPRAERDDDEDDSDEQEITPERRAELRQIAAMAMAINPVSVRRGIGNDPTKD